MKKILVGLIAAGMLLAGTSAMAYTIGVGADFQTFGDFYKFGTSSNSTVPFNAGPVKAGETLIPPVPGMYPTIHLLLGEKDTLLDIGVGFAGKATALSIGSVYPYFKITDMFKFYGGGGFTYYLAPDYPGWTYLKLSSTLIGLEINVPVIPVSAYAAGGLRFPMIFGPNNTFIMGVGWQLEVGARFYIWR